MKRRNFVNPRSASIPGERCIYGVHAVAEWIRVQPHRLTGLQYDERCRARVAEILASANAAGIPAQAVRPERLTVIAGSSRHQGLVASALPFPYVDLSAVIALHPQLIIVVDQMQDPHNLGAVLRTAGAAEVGAVILPKDNCVPVTAAVEAVAAGAAALVPVCLVTNNARALRNLKEAGYWCVALTVRDGINLYEFDPPGPIAVVVGGESGMRPLVAKQCDFKISVPMFGRVESLNASVAAAIAIYELRRRRHGQVGQPA